MKLKTKIALGLSFLFAAILGIVVLSVYYINGIANDSENVLKDNYESLTYTQRILESLDSLNFAGIESNLKLQETNVTEPGEREFTLMLRKAVDGRNVVEI